MNKAIAMLGITALTLWAGYFTMTAGWGLTIRSWPALITGWAIAFVASVLIGILKEVD